MLSLLHQNKSVLSDGIPGKPAANARMVIPIAVVIQTGFIVRKVGSDPDTAIRGERAGGGDGLAEGVVFVARATRVQAPGRRAIPLGLEGAERLSHAAGKGLTSVL